MNKLFLILIAFMWTLPRAIVFCDDLDPYIESGYNKNEVISAIAIDRESHYESECLAEGDAGSHFTYSWEFASTCSGMSGSRNGYVKSTATCNICTGQWAHDELEENENACREDCRTSNYVCRSPSFPEQWGGEIVKKNSNGGACGDFLPNCSESSSSESVESSSSEGDDSSSSFDGSSSSESGPSSSMNGRYDLVYSYNSFCNNIGHFSEALGCVPYTNSCGTGKHYRRRPGIVGPKKFRFQCTENYMDIYTNIPEIFPTDHLQIECDNPKTEESRYLHVPDIPVTYVCPDIENASIEGCPTAESISSINLSVNLENTYYASSTLDLMDDYYWIEFFSSDDDRFPSNYTKMDLLNEPEFVSFFNECKRRMKKIVDIMSMIKENGDDERQGEYPWDVYSPYASWWDYSDEYYPSQGLSSFKDYCRSVRGENAVVYQADSLIREEYYNEETSYISKRYNAFFYCAPPKSSSSSAEESSSSESSSSSEKSSSSSEESSSSEPPSSSSLSSSSEESSSSSEEIIVESSSVMPVDEPFVAGADQVYTPDQIFSSGLQNMEPGACYSLNPDRGTIYGWNISYNASDSWWWRKVDCETGEKPVEKGIGICAAFPGSKPDKVSACYAHNGSCYVCDNSKDYIDCNADWLWNYNFPTHSWFKQVDCYDPFGEEDEIIAGGCLDESLLRKVSMREYAEDDESLNYSVDFMKPVKKYDALGRHGTNKQPSHMALYQKNMGIPQQQIETFVILQIPSISSVDYCNRDSSGSWNCNKNKKGLKKRVMSVDEFVDSKRCDIKKGREYWYFIKNTDPETGEEVKTYVGGVTCAWPNVTINHEPISQKNELIYSNGKIVGAKATVKYRFYTHTTLGENNHIIMKAGDVFSDGHVVTSADETCYEKHEQGHEKYNECVSYEEVEETGTFECTVKVSGTMSKEKRTEILNDAVTADLTVKRDLFENQHLQDRLNKAQKKLDKSRDLFHADYGLDGYAGKNDKLPKSYRCPNF